MLNLYKCEPDICSQKSAHDVLDFPTHKMNDKKILPWEWPSKFLTVQYPFSQFLRRRYLSANISFHWIVETNTADPLMNQADLYVSYTFIHSDTTTAIIVNSSFLHGERLKLSKVSLHQSVSYNKHFIMIIITTVRRWFVAKLNVLLYSVITTTIIQYSIP